jgi:PAS domain S-box-containing protein
MKSRGQSKSVRVEEATYRKQAKVRERDLIAEAVEATAKYRAIFDQSPIFAGVMTIDGTVIDANRLCLEVCGYRAEEILGRFFWETGWWRFNKDVQAKIRAATIQAALGTTYREELPYHWADGTEHVVEFELHPVRDNQGKIIFLHPTGTDITERKNTVEELRNARADLEKRVQERTDELNRANESLRELSGRLLQIRDNEARTLARELHDSVGQLLAAISMNISVVKSQSHKLDERGAQAVAENELLLEQISTEIRTISHLLHPPLLDELGLRSALGWFVDGFSERSKIKVELNVSSDCGRLSTLLETAIFRIVQECLTNIHRHSGSKTAAIRILRENGQILVAEDSGNGIPPDKMSRLSDGRSGVGFRGMAERIRHLGGNLKIHSDSKGTVVTAMLPFTAANVGTGKEKLV